MDNRTLILVDSIVRYQPLHQFDETGVKDFPPVLPLDPP